MYSLYIITIINITILSLLIIILIQNSNEPYCEGCLNGKVIAGTVYTTNSDNTPGLGWIM